VTRASGQEAFAELSRNVDDSLKYLVKGNVQQHWSLRDHLDAYTEGRFNLVLHLSYRRAGNREDRCIVFDGRQWASGGQGALGDGADNGLDGGRGDEHRSDHAVLVGIVKYAEPSQEVILDSVRRAHLVGLYRLDECPHLVSEGLQVPRLSLPVGGIIDDHELQSVEVGRRVLGRHTYSECIDEMIQRTPKIVDSIANQKAPAPRIRNLVEPDVEAVVGALTSWLGLYGVGVTLGPLADFSVEGINVFTSSVDLGLYSVEGISRGLSLEQDGSQAEANPDDGDRS
jgi:hypothetical protein